VRQRGGVRVQVNCHAGGGFIDRDEAGVTGRLVPGDDVLRAEEVVGRRAALPHAPIPRIVSGQR